MVNEEGDPKISKIMEARDSKGNLEEDSDSDFDYCADPSDEDLALEFEKLSAADKSDIMNGLTFTPNINETRELEEVSARSYEIFLTKTSL